MNYYKHYMGDYQRDTGHLSLAQDGAYRRLMDHYYSTEKPLPSDADALYRICGAMNKKERDSVDFIAQNFFQNLSGFLHHSRIDSEIESAREKIGKLAASGYKGGVNSAASRASKRQGNEQAIAEANAEANASKNADHTNNQYPVNQEEAAAAVPEVPRDPDASNAPPLPGRQEPKTEPNPALVLTTTLRKMGVNVTSMHPILLAWVSGGVKLEQLVEAVGIARERKGADEKLAPGYVHAILGDILNPQPAGKNAPPVEVKPWWLSVTGIDAKGAELGLALQDGETFPYFKARVYAAAGPGPWSEMGARSAQPITQGFTKISKVVDVAAEREKMKQITRQNAVN